VTVPTIEVNGTELFYQVEGEGEPLVLVHGSWGDHFNWQLVGPGLAQSFRVLAYTRTIWAPCSRCSREQGTSPT
jgi:pimeloyl-ACP methyl ester carboxylesterase